MIDKYDSLECRCGMLGHMVPFKYCRSVTDKLPCRKIFDCWFAAIPIEDYIHAHYTEEEIREILAPPQPKMSSIISLIEKAKSND